MAWLCMRRSSATREVSANPNRRGSFGAAESKPGETGVGGGDRRIDSRRPWTWLGSPPMLFSRDDAGNVWRYRW